MSQRRRDRGEKAKIGKGELESREFRVSPL